MGKTVASWARFGVAFVTLGIVLSPVLIFAQAPPMFPSTPGQAETSPTSEGQTQGEQPSGTQAQPPGQATSPGFQPDLTPEAKPADPFAGSPLLQMFERQPNASAPIRQSRFAPVAAEAVPFGVSFFLTAEEEFTDNVNQTKEDRKSEFSTRITPGLSIRADRPWVNLGLSYAPSVFIQNNSIGDTELNQNLSARVALWPSGRFQLNIAEGFTDSNDFRDQQDPGSRLTGTNNYIENVVTVEAAYVLPRLRTALAYTNLFNQTDVGFTDTRINHSARPSVVYTDPRFTVSGSYTVTRGDENSAVAIPYWSHLGDARFSYVLTPTISPVLTGSYEYTQPDIGLNYSTGRGLVGGTFAIGADGTFDLLGGFAAFSTQGEDTEVKPSFSLAYTQRFAPVVVTARYDSLYENRSSGGNLDDAGVTYTRSAGLFFSTTPLLFRQLIATLGIRWIEEEFLQVSSFGGPPGTKDRTWDFDVSLRYPLTRWLSINGGYTGTIRTSTQSSAEFNENRVRLGLTYQYILF